jgi:Family of unknown function (DUF6152)
MLKRIYLVLFLVCSLGLVSFAPAYAHHSASSEYDVQRTIQVTGVMTKFDWVNPHAEMQMNVPDGSGHMTPWAISFAGLSKLRLAGMNRSTLTVGEKYVCIGNPAHNGLHRLLINKLIFPDGKVFQLSPDYKEGAQQ